MHITMYKLYYGNYNFVAEFDSSSEHGNCELGLWYREKRDIHTIPLKEIPKQLLIKALAEPYNTLLLSQLEALKSDIQRQMDSAITEFLRPYQNSDHQQPQRKLPRAVKKRSRQLRNKCRQQIQQTEQTFYQQEILTLERHCFNLDLIAPECHIYGDWHYIRTFYFEEVNKDNIHTFCREFASIPQYREEILTGKRRWAKRNALFIQNLSSLLGKKSAFAEDGSYVRQAREFFRWLDINTEAILAHPDYQRLLTLDSTCHNCIINNQYTLPEAIGTSKPGGSSGEPERGVDPSLRPAVDIFHRLPGITYAGSCQGISGKVHVQPYDIMVVTPHQEHAYISFGTLSYLLHDLIIELLPQFPAIIIQHIPHFFTQSCTLSARGDNLQFRAEINMLTMQIHAELAESLQQQAAHIITAKQTSRWEEVCYPGHYVPTEEPGGLLPSRSVWLCQSMQIEHTLYLLFHLNHWAKASDRLYYTDRQGLYSVKATLIREAYRQGQLQASGYIDGSVIFRKELDVELATGMAVELIMDIDVTLISEFGMNPLEKRAQDLYQRVIGHDFNVSAPQEHEREQLTTYIQTTLNTMIKDAMQSRQPLDCKALADLLIMPADLLHIPWERARYINNWDDLDEGDLRKIDPEGWSLIAFRYEHEQTRYTFHLPYRVAEQFMAEECIKNLNSIARESNEYGVYYGRPITDQESERHPIAEILWELCVYTEGICPHKLERKDQRPYTSTTTWHHHDEDDEEDDLVGEWEELEG